MCEKELPKPRTSAFCHCKEQLFTYGDIIFTAVFAIDAGS